MSIKRFNGAGVYGAKSNKVWDQSTYLNDFQSIATVIVPSGGQSTITFTNIPQTYAHLELRISARMNRADYADNIAVRVGNGSADTTNYSWHEFRGDGSGLGSTGEANASYMYINDF